MSDNLDNKSSNPKQSSTVKNDPFYADELDVLEALVKLEKKYGKEFLTKEQRQLLTKRLGDMPRQKHLHEVASVSPEVVKKFATSDLYSGVVNMFAQIVRDDLGQVRWDGLTEKQKLETVNARMYVETGTSIQTMKNRIDRLVESL